MTPADRERFAEVLAALAASFGKEADVAMAEGYWMGLADIELEEFERACARAIRESQFFPKPVELRRHAGYLAADLRAVLAWDVVCNTIARHGYVASVDFDDPLVNAAIRNMGGWPRLCAMPSEEFQVWGRKEFERIYGALCESGTSAEACMYLPGAHEGNNAAKGYEVVPPARVACKLPPHKTAVIRGLTGTEANVLRLVAGLASKKSIP
jgi:hypothetical protein